jgi:hypothetical protein
VKNRRFRYMFINTLLLFECFCIFKPYTFAEKVEFKEHGGRANFFSLKAVPRSRGSSVSIVSDYGLDDRGSIPERSRGFFF